MTITLRPRSATVYESPGFALGLVRVPDASPRTRVSTDRVTPVATRDVCPHPDWLLPRCRSRGRVVLTTALQQPRDAGVLTAGRSGTVSSGAERSDSLELDVLLVSPLDPDRECPSARVPRVGMYAAPRAALSVATAMVRRTRHDGTRSRRRFQRVQQWLDDATRPRPHAGSA
jgi:hypothetical protein